MGAITPLGLSTPAFWAALVEGRSGIGPITRFATGDFDSRIGGELKGFDPGDFMDRKEAKRNDPYTQYAIAAAREAMEQSGLDMSENNGERIGCIIGSGIGGSTTWEAQHTVLMEKGPARVSPFFVPMMIADMASGQLSMIYGARGPNFATVSACASGAHAIGESFELVRSGELDAAIAGGSEAPITPLAVAGFCSMKALSTRNDEPAKASRPFEKDRDGFVIGEGSAVLILESETHARRRGAPILAELAGYGASSDAYHITAPPPGGEGAVRSMRAALRSAGARPEDVDYINAHGTSTPLNDKYETMAIHTVFGAHARQLVISSTKSMTGHLLGAAGAIELVASILAVKNGLIPPTINYDTPDPECDLDYAPNQARHRQIRLALSNSFGFGGHNVTLAVRGYGEAG